ncbi:ribonuclease R [Paludibacterium paludis]|uniref:Ribonuclease R n=1 Tax=Paludibacterium paludis TaxID=1225769 RepID=A0A918NZ20_9NEIS|nr:ribonuclease R [Paludibacterium paludis]
MAAKQNKAKKTPLRQQDPYLEREKLKYSNPLPSREFILSILAEQGVPLFAGELAQMLSIEAGEDTFFERRLRAMEREGQIIINRKGAVCVAGKLDLIKCTVQGHRDGYGFAVPAEEGRDDLFLPEREMRKVMHGDTVMVRHVGADKRGRAEGAVVEVLDRAVTQVVGRIYHERGVWLVVPEDRRISHDILIEQGGEGGAGHGQVVVAGIVTPPDSHRQAIGRVIEVLGNYADPGMEIEIALRKHELPYLFSAEAEAQAAATPRKVRKKDIKGRVDLREMPLVTIDGETARDFDDAVFAEPKGKGFRLVVAIADVSFYVTPDDALDREARERGTSVYFPRRVIPMLPEALSNGICSLNPDVERLCMVCDMTISAKGAVKSYEFYPAVMKSKARLTYEQVWGWLQHGSDHPVMPHLTVLHSLFRVLLAAREKRGAIEFESSETRMIFNKDGKIDRIVPVVRNDAHRLIEECMLAANVCAADFILKNKAKCLFRVHEGPTEEKLEHLRAYLRLVGLTLGGEDRPTTKDYAHLAEKIEGRPDAHVLQTMLLRSMQQAVYTPENNGHFGLAYEAYTHFTSPIRRYPDLLLHRAIKGVLDGQAYKPGKWAKLGEHCSMTERRADDASRDVESWLKTFYMRDKVGEVFTGRISAVTSFGVFVLLDEVYVEGLVHISELGRDYFHYRKDIQAIVGEKSGLRYQLGDGLTVRVVRADLEASKIDFQIVRPEEVTEPKPASAPARGKPDGKRHGQRRGKEGGMAAPSSQSAKDASAAASSVPEAPAVEAAPAPASRRRRSKPAGQAGVSAAADVPPVAPAAPTQKRRRSPGKPAPSAGEAVAPANPESGETGSPSSAGAAPEPRATAAKAPAESVAKPAAPASRRRTRRQG